MKRIITTIALMMMSPLLLCAQCDYQTLQLRDTTIAIPRLSPVPVDGVASLDGTWQFTDNAAKNDYNSAIEVPGQWTQQGFNVPANQWAGYSREIAVPSKWKNSRIFIRFDAVFSGCEVYVNDRKVREHLGGFTPFEADITDAVKVGGKNRLVVKVLSESIADSVASASNYASHQLGGITRKVRMFALPQTNIGYLQVATLMDKDYKDSRLSIDYILDNRAEKEIRNSKMIFTLTDLSSGAMVLSKEHNADVKSGVLSTFSVDVKSPKRWDPEHPNLYRLTTKLINADGSSESTERTVGFRKIEVRDAKVFVNGTAVLLRGVNRHEVMPLRGRSLTGDMWQKDVELFRAANVNYIRTSHYPPAEEFIEACNLLGMFVEVEAPFCWAHNTQVDEKHRKTVLEDQTLSMVNNFRSNPSVLMWSMGNESMKYVEYFKHTAHVIGLFDTLRPRIFSQWGPDADNGELEVTNYHYPGLNIAGFEKSTRPVTFDEFCHLNSYNRLEYIADPSLRDVWGLGLEHMWEKMRRTKAVLGGGLWSGIDDTFFLPDGKIYGYGTWGPLDGWRREKPEYWHVKKIYSPIKVAAEIIDDKTVVLSFENRFLFSNLSECQIEWRSDTESGVVKLDASPSKTVKDTLTVRGNLQSNKSLRITVTDTRGVVVDCSEFPLFQKPVSINITQKHDLKVNSTDGVTTVDYTDVTLSIDVTQMTISKSGKTVVNSLPSLMILPLTSEGYGIQMKGASNEGWQLYSDVCKNRVIHSIETIAKNDGVIIRINDEYKEAYGSMTIKLSNTGVFDVSYQYKIRENISPRQLGLVFELPKSYDRLVWQRYGQWNFYPKNHIGRLTGEAIAFNGQKMSGPTGPGWTPDCEWKDDCTQWGTNDFRSTKHNVIISKLSSAQSGASLSVVSNGTLNTRSWVDGNSTKFLISPYSNLGTEGFFRDHAKEYDKPLTKGEQITGKFTLLIE